MIRRPPRSTLFPYTTALPIFDLLEELGAAVKLDQLQGPGDKFVFQSALTPADETQEHLQVGDSEAHDHVLRTRSEEHTSELQSRQYLVCRLLLEKKKIFYSVY